MKKIPRVLFVLALVVGICTLLSVPSLPAFAQGQGNCLDPNATGYIKEDTGGTSVTINADAGFIIKSVTVKAGSDESTSDPCTTFTQNGTFACYAVSGLGTGSVTVTKVGSGPDCKDISHLEAIEVTPPTETPPTETPPTETPPTETPPTETPPTETPPTETPTETPTVTPTDPTPTNTPDPTTPVPTDTPTSTPVPTYDIPPESTANVVLPVTGAELGSSSSSLGLYSVLGLVGFGMVGIGLKRKFRK